MKSRRQALLRQRVILRLERLESRTTPASLTPTQVRHAYGFDQITGNGAGQTIAIVAAYDHPTIASDLHQFDVTFGLPDPPIFRKVNQNGGTTYPAPNVSWAGEIALDVQWAHAMAPAANIVLVEAWSNSLADLMAAVDYAARFTGASVVSMSWGTSEFSTQRAYDWHFSVPGVTFVAASGDGGIPLWPAVSPNVVAVGGTTLWTDTAGNVLSETAWNGSGGGISQYESKPAYQNAILGGSRRGTPDVAYGASPSTGYYVYNTFGGGGWSTIGGTSAGAPQWAALVAIANQGRRSAGLPALSGAATLSAIYSAQANDDFRDTVSGSNRGYRAGAGYDLVTGRGSPIASRVVADLVGGAASTVVSGTSGSSSRSSTTSTSAGSSGWWGWWGQWFDSSFGFLAGRMAAVAPTGAVSMTMYGPGPMGLAYAPVLPSPMDQAIRSASSGLDSLTPFLRPRANAAWWQKPDTESVGRLRSADAAEGAGPAADDHADGEATPADGAA
jgi:hypothetical protein